MSDYQPNTGYAAIAQVEAYWEAVRGSRLLPNRSDIDPRGIEQALEYAFILERIAPSMARLRLAGSHLTALMGMEVRGMPLTAFFVPEARADLSDLLEAVFQTPATATLNLSSAGDMTRPDLEARLILLPLKSDLGDVSRILGCLVGRGTLGQAPRRFEITHQDVVKIAEGQPSLPVVQPHTKPQLPVATSPNPSVPSGFAEDKTPFKGQGGKVRPPYLRLIKSDD